MLARVSCLRSACRAFSTRPAFHAQRSVSMTAHGADDEQVAKRQKVEEKTEYTMDINTAVDKDHEKKALSELVDAPVTVLQGVGPKSAEVLKQLGVETIKDLADFKFYRMAKAIDYLSKTSNGKRAEGSKFNIDKAVMAGFEAKTLNEIVGAPVATLQGLSKEKAEHLKVLHVHTVKELADLSCAHWAEAIVELAKFEEAA